MCVQQRVFCRKYYYYVTWQCSHLLLSAVLRRRCSRALAATAVDRYGAQQQTRLTLHAAAAAVE